MIDLSPITKEAIRTHARYEFPKEACGLLVDGEYLRCTNFATDPENHFVIDPRVLAQVKSAGKVLTAIVHSHPNGNAYPSGNDMQGQIDSAVPWIILPLTENVFGEFVCWGDSLPMRPLLGRSFVHGITDCYSAIRDLYRLGKDAAAEQGFDKWPLDPILLPEVPRNDAWWGKEGQAGEDLYTKGFANGFKVISAHEARPGDGFLCKIRSNDLNHAGLLISNDLLFHHLPGRLSRREPAGLWARAADTWVRYVGPQNA